MDKYMIKKLELSKSNIFKITIFPIPIPLKLEN